ncbi:Metalloprotease [Fomitiporia mediterranea MF3/22]|uniref:Metalloprotease n=1 Tax=Fomitiporia mediterranea (strain MF3/22) TaxID=694068 RepID=UPI0004408162|nr:Metalloprotease [Fomitiporia mediterranea MF3/22]EJC99683.1 Metalloprotease [Fomitiporia mediterranea MF3/22]
MSNLTPPQPPPTWQHKPEEVLDLSKKTIDHVKQIYDRVGALDAKDCTFDSVYGALAKAEAETQVLDPVLFYQNVSTSKELRDASNQAETLVRNFLVELEMRVDVFTAKKNADANIKAQGVKLNVEQRRLIEKMLLDGKRAGLDLSEDKRKVLEEKKKELNQLCVEFSKNFNEEAGKIFFTEEELKGVPADVVSGYEKRVEDSKVTYGVTHKTPDTFPLFKYAQNPDTRRKAFSSYENRLAVNVPILNKCLDLRREIAPILGYATWADYITEEKMAKSAKSVNEFLDDLEQKLRPVGVKDRETLLEMKRKEHESTGLPFDGEFYIWDYRYYDRKFTEERLALDDALVKEYFPVSFVVPAVLEIYQKLLGVRFEPIKSTELWHPDAELFSVWSADAKDESGFVGYCYLDLFPREAKYSHAAVWPLIPGYDIEGGKRNFPVAAMVANLAKPTPERPALMRHDDVVTFFHEMGHVFHGLLSKTQYSRFHGTNVARDFVEAPSQMLENWCWEPKVLKYMSQHFKTKEPLSDDLIKKIIDSRYVNIGLYYLRQLFFAKFDIKVHTDQEPTDYTALWNNLRTHISLVKGSKEPEPGQGTFGHITGGYDAGYYGYMYSLVFAADMYATVFKKDPLDPALGQKYRKEILLPGGSRDDLDSLKAFLGRPPNSEAFLKELFGSS